MSKFIAILQTGQAIDTVLQKHGDFNDLFIQHLQAATTQTFKVFESLTFPPINSLAGIIITGSAAMVTDKLDWSEATIAWLKPVLELNIPVLGVCYGHQLLATALGGQVDWNPNGRQIGTVPMQITDESHTDPLFSSINPKQHSVLDFNATHLQAVTVIPKHVTLLGSSKLDENFCFRYKNHVWGTQFHPEFSTQVIQHYLQARHQQINQEGLDAKEIAKHLRDNDNGKNLLTRFRDLCFNT